MENVLFYLLIILCLGLIITLAVYMNKYNNMKMLFEAADKTSDNLLQERMTLQKQNAEDQYQLSKSDSLAKQFSAKLTEVSEQNTDLIYKCDKQAAEIESLQSINATLLADNRKLADQISNTGLDKMETKKGQIKQIVPNELMDQTQLISTILHSINTYNNLYPKGSTKFNRELIEAINGTIKENKVKK